MSVFNQFGTDKAKEAEGVEVPFAPNEDGTIPVFTIAATSRNNQKYAKELERVTKPYRRNMDALRDEQAEKLFMNVFVETVLKGWRNIKDKLGNEIPYTKENAIELFKALPRLYDELQSKAGGIEAFREEARETESGN